jgi:hypothetical protein
MLLLPTVMSAGNTPIVLEIPPVKFMMHKAANHLCSSRVGSERTMASVNCGLAIDQYPIHSPELPRDVPFYYIDRAASGA